jgi:hypothetical protein
MKMVSLIVYGRIYDLTRRISLPLSPLTIWAYGSHPMHILSASLHEIHFYTTQEHKVLIQQSGLLKSSMLWMHIKIHAHIFKEGTSLFPITLNVPIPPLQPRCLITLHQLVWGTIVVTPIPTTLED